MSENGDKVKDSKLGFGVDALDLDSKQAQSIIQDEEHMHVLTPRPWYKNKLYTVAIFALFVEMCERLTFYTINGSQSALLTNRWGYSRASATAMGSSFQILCYAFCILGGWLADSFFGRYKTILGFTSFYIVGCAMAAISTYPSIDNQALYFVGVFVFIALGTGGIKPNISNFGADQYVTNGPNEADNARERKEQAQFFSWFYLMINVGAAVSYGYLATLASSGGGSIPKEDGYFAAYMIAFGCMFIALVIFLAGTPRYIKKLPAGNSIHGLVYFIWESAKRNKKGKFSVLGWISLIIFVLLAFSSAFLGNDVDSQKIISYIALGIGVFATFTLSVCHVNNDHLIGIPDHESGIMTNLEARGTLDCFPIILIINICFNLMYNCMNGPWQAQACQSNILIGGTQINGSFFNIADCFAIIVFVPIFEYFLFPFLQTRVLKREITRTEKIIAGLTVGSLAIVFSIIGEILRRNSGLMEPLVQSNCANEGSYLSNFSGIYMFLPFGLMGIAEILINPPILHFSYDQAPPRTRSLTQAFNMVCLGTVSNSYTGPVTLAMQKYVPDNLDAGHVEYLYIVCIVCGLLGIPLFLILNKHFVEKEWVDEEEESPPSYSDKESEMVKEY